MSDTIANALNKVKIASQLGKEKVDLPASKLLLRIVQLLKEERYIKNYRQVQGIGMGNIRIYLQYENKQSLITGMKRVSKPGLRIYRDKTKIPIVRGGLGTAILTTSKGVLTDKQARESGVGGEVLCYVW